MTSYVQNHKGKLTLLYVLTIFIVGLWPFNVTQSNEVSIRVPDGLKILNPGSAYTLRPVEKMKNLDQFTIYLDLASESAGKSGLEKIFSYGINQNELNFIVGQWKNALDFTLRVGNEFNIVHIGSEEIWNQGIRTRLVIACSGNILEIYQDGIRKRRFIMGTVNISGWSAEYPLVVGTDASGRSQWKGSLYQVAIWDKSLAPAEVEYLMKQALGDCGPEAKGRRKNETSARLPLIHYIFKPECMYETEYCGHKVLAAKDLGKGMSADLIFPAHFAPYNRVVLGWGSNWTNYKSNLTDMAINLLGFVPLGIFFMLLLTERGIINMTALFIIGFVGFSTSLTIEYVQAFLPSRDSSMKDVIMNTAGAVIGSVGYRLVAWTGNCEGEKK